MWRKKVETIKKRKLSGGDEAQCGGGISSGKGDSDRRKKDSNYLEQYQFRGKNHNDDDDESVSYLNNEK